MTEEQEEQKIADGFNAGYILQQNKPELLKEILKVNNQDKEIIQAIEKGQQQAQREKIIEKQLKIREKDQEKKHNR